MISINVNGQSREVASASETPLLYVLRNDLAVLGPKFGCGMAQCGACSVLLDGEEIRACITPVSDVAGKSITTLEGLAARWTEQKKMVAPAALHPVQQAWIDEQVPQCGFCQNGMMIKAAELLEKNPKPTDAQIRDAFTTSGPSPHLCRCGSYQAIMDGVKQAAKLMAGDAA